MQTTAQQIYLCYCLRNLIVLYIGMAFSISGVSHISQVQNAGYNAEKMLTKIQTF